MNYLKKREEKKNSNKLINDSFQKWKKLKQVRREDLFLDAWHDKVNLKKTKTVPQETKLLSATKENRILSSHNTTRKQKHNITKKKQTSRQILNNWKQSGKKSKRKMKAERSGWKFFLAKQKEKSVGEIFKTKSVLWIWNSRVVVKEVN